MHTVLDPFLDLEILTNLKRTENGPKLEEESVHVLL